MMNNDPKTMYDISERFAMSTWSKRELNEVYTFTDSFSEEEIESIHNICQKLPITDGEIGHDHDEYTVNDEVRISSVRWVPINEETKFIYDRLYNMVMEANEELWGFDLTGFIEEAQYTEYYGNNNGHYDWHLDLGEEVDYRKISITIQLSDSNEYEGGELEILKGPTPVVVEKEKGLGTLFPSYLLHRVNNVNSGVRRSLVLWVTGPSFK